MSLTKIQKRQIASKARTVSERLGSESAYEDVSDDTEDWLAEWQDAAADGDFDVFLDRLRLSEVTIEEARKRLSARNPSSEDVPDWVHRLEEITDYLEREAADAPPENPLGGTDVPFAHLLSAFVEYASARVDWPEAFTEHAREGFERWLLERLQVLTSHVLFIEFKTFIAQDDPELATADDPEVPDDARRYYDEFTRNLRTGGLGELLAEYAVLSRLLVFLIENWVDAVVEFVARLESDVEVVATEFNGSEPLGKLRDVDVYGDPHRGGRRVFGLEFESDVRIAYKPRDLGPESAFYHLVSWVNERSDLPSLATVSCLSRDGYGWMKWVDHEACSTEAGVSRYYERAGMFLSLLYAMNFTDGHVENLLAHGEDPIVVDLETILHPTLSNEVRERENDVFSISRDSVLRTGFLPMHLPDADVTEISGLGAGDGKQTGVEIPEFTDVNTDVMDLCYRDTHHIEGESLPRYDGESVGPGAYHDEIARGFEQMYRFLLDQRDELLARDGPLAAFSDVDVRYLFRPTSIYGKVQVPFTTPSYLRTGLKWGHRIERLTRPFAKGNIDDDLWKVYEAERDALWQLDVPRLTVPATDVDVVRGDEVISDAFDVSPLSNVRSNIRSLDRADLVEQLDYISLAYESEQLGFPTTERTANGDESELLLDDRTAEREAREIFGRIHDAASKTREDGLTWYLREFRADGAYLHGMLQNFYNGRSGVALYAGALADTFSEQVYSDFAVAIADAVDEAISKPGWAEDKRLGRAGVGSLVYSFTKLSDLLDEPEYYTSARTAMAELTTDRIRDDDVFDVITGCAGIVLALVALYEATSDEVALSKAVTAGERLLDTRIQTDHGVAWNTLSPDNPSLGMSHGVGGIAYALFRLAEVTGEDRFREVADRAIAYERSRFRPPRADWDAKTKSSFIPGWCAGLAGFGLTSLKLFELTGRVDFRRDVERAVDGIDTVHLTERDHLCGGTFGQVAFLTQAGRRLDAPSLVQSGRELAGRSLDRASDSGFTVPWQTDEWYNPSFFVGEAGIGYELLRLSNAELPSVLLWE